MATTFPRRAHHTSIHAPTSDAHGYGAFQLPRHSATEQASSDYGGLPYPDAQHHHHVDHNNFGEQTPADQNNVFSEEHNIHSTREDEAPNTIMADHPDFDMLPPTPSTHSSWQALHDYAQTHAAQHGYALSINTTAKNRSRIKLACVCYGQPKNTHKLTAETRVRKNRVSYKTGCGMWIEGKKRHDGMWILNIGEAQHNHPGRPSEGWAVQRKRTWGNVGGRIGMGGVTAKEELARLASEGRAAIELDEEDDGDGIEGQPDQTQSNNIHERGGLVWKIVEEEMDRKDGTNQGRDRGVGRTVEVLQARLPGIHIFKRDVYNIRAQIKRARKVAEQQSEESVYDERLIAHTRPHPHMMPIQILSAVHESNDEDDDDDDDDAKEEIHARTAIPERRSIHIPSALDDNERLSATLIPSHSVLSASEMEIAQLRSENAQLKVLLAETRKALKEKSIEVASLRTQADFARDMNMLPG